MCLFLFLVNNLGNIFLSIVCLLGTKMTYTLVTVGLVLITAIIFLPRFKGFVERQNHAVNFFLTLVATLVGVLLAIAITNYEESQKEKQDVAKLISASINSVETSREYSESLYKHYLSLPKSKKQQAKFFEKNTLPYPEYLDVFISQSLVSKNLSEAALSDLNELLINLKRSIDRDPKLYIEILKRTEALLNTELTYQRGELSYAELERHLDKIEDRPLPK